MVGFTSENNAWSIFVEGFKTINSNSLIDVELFEWFLLVYLLVDYVIQGIFPFNLSCSMLWCKVVHIIPYSFNVCRIFHSFICNLYWPCCIAHGILVPQPGIELVPPAVEAQSPSQWTTGKFLDLSLFILLIHVLSFCFPGQSP